MQNFDFTPLANASQDFAHQSFNHFVATANQMGELVRTFLQESSSNASKALAPAASADAFANVGAAAAKDQARATLRYASATAKLAVEHAQHNVQSAQELAEHSASHWKAAFPSSARFADALQPTLKAAVSAQEYSSKALLRMAAEWERVAQSA